MGADADDQLANSEYRIRFLIGEEDTVDVKR